jgi:hypothetical protein
MIASSQLPLERRDVDMLEKPQAKSVVDLVECADDGLGQRSFDEVASHVATVTTPGDIVVTKDPPVASASSVSFASSGRLSS